MALLFFEPLKGNDMKEAGLITIGFIIWLLAAAYLFQ